MIALLVESQILNTGVMSIKVGEHTKCKGVPHKDVPLFTTACNEPTFLRVDKRVDWLLVDVEGLLIFVLKLFDVMDMDKTVDR